MRAIPRSDTSPYWMTREPPLNCGRRDVRVVGALGRVEDVVGDVEAELDEARADDRQDRREQVERSGDRGDRDAEQRPGRSSR